MIAICGNFAKNDLNVVNGQVTKTRNLFHVLNNLPNEKIRVIDTSKNKLLLFLSIFLIYFKCDTFFLCVSRNGTKLLTPLLRVLKKIRKKTKILFFCIGTCPLPRDYVPGAALTKKELRLGKKLSCFNYVCAETKTMKKELENVFNLKNIVVFKNYQTNKNIVKCGMETNGRFVFFSRISHEKNIEELFEALDKLDRDFSINISIDFYGPIESSILDLFEKQVSARKNCEYKGIINSDESISTLANYNALIFTTKCLEGTPGAIVDAAFANLPVLSQSFWASKELIETSGIGIVDNDISNNIKNFLSMNKNEVNNLKNNCYNFAMSYSFEEAIDMINTLIYN